MASQEVLPCVDAEGVDGGLGDADAGCVVADVVVVVVVAFGDVVVVAFGDVVVVAYAASVVDVALVACHQEGHFAMLSLLLLDADVDHRHYRVLQLDTAS